MADVGAGVAAGEAAAAGEPTVRANGAAGGDQVPEAPERKSMWSVTFPTHASSVLFAALALGLVLTGVGLIVKLTQAGADVQANACLATGIGVLLAAFGGQAEGRFGGFVLAGVVAITAFLLWFLSDESEKYHNRFMSSYVQGQIRLDTNEYGLAIKARNDFYTLKESTSYGFVALMKDVAEGVVELTVYPRERLSACKVPPPDCEIPFRIPRRLFEDAVAAKQSLDWTFDEPNLAFFDQDNVRAFGLEIRPEPVPDSQTTGAANPLSFLSISAIAQTPAGPATGVNAAGDEPDLDPGLASALGKLTSDDATERREARKDLAAGPLTWVPAIANELLEKGENYRVRLGTSVALAEMLRYNKNAAGEFSTQLRPEHLHALLGASADPDRTLRIYASEFLYDLGDPRLVTPALDLLGETEDPNGKYNLILVLGSAMKAPDLPLAEKQVALERLEAIGPTLGPATQELATQILEDNR